MSDPITKMSDLPERGSYEVDLPGLEPFCLVPILVHLRDILHRPDMQPPSADLKVTFEGLSPRQVRMLLSQLDAGFLGALVSLVDKNGSIIADVSGSLR
jgi:hypothetical protein